MPKKSKAKSFGKNSILPLTIDTKNNQTCYINYAHSVTQGNLILATTTTPIDLMTISFMYKGLKYKQEVGVIIHNDLVCSVRGWIGTDSHDYQNIHIAILRVKRELLFNPKITAVVCRYDRPYPRHPDVPLSRGNIAIEINVFSLIETSDKSLQSLNDAIIAVQKRLSIFAMNGTEYFDESKVKQLTRRQIITLMESAPDLLITCIPLLIDCNTLAELLPSRLIVEVMKLLQEKNEGELKQISDQEQIRRKNLLSVYLTKDVITIISEY